MLSPRWKKVLGDLLQNKTRAVLAVLSIAVGVLAIGMVGTTQVSLSENLNRTYLATNPASATLSVAGGTIDDSVVSAVRALPGVADAEGRRTVSVRVETGPDSWRNLQLIAVANLNDLRISKFHSEQGAWPPATGEIALERGSLDWLGAKVGDTLSVQDPLGRQFELRLTGLVHDVGQFQAGLSGTARAYVDFSTLNKLGVAKTYGELRIVVPESPMDKAHIQSVAASVRGYLETQGISVGSINVPDPGKHPYDSIVQAMLLLLTSLGASTLVLSAFLVVNTVSALLAQQTRQIGVMKAIGARAPQVTSMYLLFVLALGVCAAAVGIPLGALGAIIIDGFASGLLNVDSSGFAVPVQILALELGVALLVPLLSALYPVLSGSRISPHKAMSNYGLGQEFARSGLVDRVVGMVRSFPRPILLSLHNTFQHKRRLALTLATLSLGGALFISVYSVRDSTARSLEDAVNYFRYDIEVRLNAAHSASELVKLLESSPTVKEAAALTLTGSRRPRADGSESANISIVGVPEGTDLIRPTLVEGRWLVPGDQNALVVTTSLQQQESDLKVGDSVILSIRGNPVEWHIVGVARYSLPESIAYASSDYVSGLAGTQGNANAAWLVTGGADSATLSRQAVELESMLKKAGVSVSSVRTTTELRSVIDNQFNIIISFLMAMAGLVALVGALGLMGSLSLSILERTKEIGVLRAIGASDGAVRQIVIVEAVLIGLLSWLGGAIIAIPVSRLLSDAVGNAFMRSTLSYTFSITGLAIWLGSVVLLAVLASLLPARKASKVAVRDVLAYE